MKDDKGTSKLEISSWVLLALCFIMNGYVAFQINRYFKISYAMIFFVIVLLLIFGLVFLVLKKKKKISIVLNILLVIVMGVASFGAHRISQFTNKIFDNSESETILIVALKDSNITADTDFTNKKIGFTTIDGNTNTYAEELLTDKNKTGFVKTEFNTHKETFEGLENGSIDMMVYTVNTDNSLQESDIISADKIKIVLEMKRDMAPVEAKTIDITKDPFNIYISGVDLSSDDINEKGNSDVNIIMSVNPKTKKIIMQTIPRDTWASLPCMDDRHTKLTYAGVYGGIDCSIKAIEGYFNHEFEINYYAKINFQGVVDLVDALGGITVNSDVAFCSSPGSSDCFAAGPNTLNGARALTFSRIRKVFSEGDIARGRHQMEVINAVIRKFSEEPTMAHLNSLLGAVENNFTTNLTQSDIGKALELFMSMKDSLGNIESDTMKGQMLWNDDEVRYEYLYYFYPDNGEVDLFLQRMNSVLKGE